MKKAEKQLETKQKDLEKVQQKLLAIDDDATLKKLFDALDEDAKEHYGNRFEYKKELKEDLEKRETSLKEDRDFIHRAKRARIQKPRLIPLSEVKFPSTLESPVPDFSFHWVERPEKDMVVKALLKTVKAYLSSSRRKGVTHSKATFETSLIYGLMGSGKTRMAVQACGEAVKSLSEDEWYSCRAASIMIDLADVVKERPEVQALPLTVGQILLGVLL